MNVSLYIIYLLRTTLYICVVDMYKVGTMEFLVIFEYSIETPH